MTVVVLPQTIPYQPVRMTVDRYHALVRAGAFTEHDRVELLDGVVTEQLSKAPRHSATTRRCDSVLSGLVPAGWHVRNQEPVTLQRSEPEPDVAIVSGSLSDYTDRHPSLGDIIMVVEVADASLVTDRYKARIYAGAGIPEYWIINLVDRVVEVYRLGSDEAAPTEYGPATVYQVDAEIPLVIAGRQIATVGASEVIS